MATGPAAPRPVRQTSQVTEVVPRREKPSSVYLRTCRAARPGQPPGHPDRRLTTSSRASDAAPPPASRVPRRSPRQSPGPSGCLGHRSPLSPPRSSLRPLRLRSHHHWLPDGARPPRASSRPRTERGTRDHTGAAPPSSREAQICLPALGLSATHVHVLAGLGRYGPGNHAPQIPAARMLGKASLLPGSSCEGLPLPAPTVGQGTAGSAGASDPSRTPITQLPALGPFLPKMPASAFLPRALTDTRKGMRAEAFGDQSERGRYFTQEQPDTYTRRGCRSDGVNPGGRHVLAPQRRRPPVQAALPREHQIKDHREDVPT